MLSAFKTRSFAILLAVAVLLGTATLVHAQSTSFFSGEGSLARQINCGVFGLLQDLGVMRSTGSCDSPAPPPQPPPPTPPGPPPTPPPPPSGTLRIVKNVSGGTSTPSMFTLHLVSNGTTTIDSHFPGSATGSDFTLAAGSTYTVTELSEPEYSASFSSDCSGTMPASGSRTCTVTNTFTGTSTASSTLRIIKMVSGGSATSSDFQISVMKDGAHIAGSPATGTAMGTTYMNLGAGTYMVSEATTTNYMPAFSGDCNASGAITLTGASSTATCTITNTFSTSTPTTTMLTVRKVVEGGTSTPAAFQIHVKNATSSSATTSVDVAGSPAGGTATGTVYALPFGSYWISESGGPSGYTLSFSGDCDASGFITLSTSSAMCTLTNSATTSATTLVTLSEAQDSAGNSSGRDSRTLDVSEWLARLFAR